MPLVRICAGGGQQWPSLPRPNSYAEVRDMPLPNPHLTVRYSTQYYKFWEGGESMIGPDREIIPT